MLAGSPYPNETLQVKAPDDFEISSIQWMKVVDGKEVAIPGEVGSTYTVKPDDLGIEIYPVIAVTPSSARKKVITKPAPPSVKSLPAIEVLVGESASFSFTPAVFEGSDFSVETEWFVNGVSVGASKPQSVGWGSSSRSSRKRKTALARPSVSRR